MKKVNASFQQIAPFVCYYDRRNRKYQQIVDQLEGSPCQPLWSGLPHDKCIQCRTNVDIHCVSTSVHQISPLSSLVVPDMNATHLLKSNPFLLRESLSALNKLTAMPILTTGMSKNLVRTSPTLKSRALTRIIQDLSFLSLDSSIITEKWLFLFRFSSNWSQ